MGESAIGCTSKLMPPCASPPCAPTVCLPGPSSYASTVFAWLVPLLDAIACQGHCHVVGYMNPIMLLHLTCTNGHGAAAYLPAAMLQGGVVPDLLPELLKPENGVLGALSDLMPLCLPATASTQQGECSSTGGANSAGTGKFSRHGLVQQAWTKFSRHTC